MKWELELMRRLDGWWSSALLDSVIPWLTHIGSHIAIMVFLGGTWVLSGKLKPFQSAAILYIVLSALIYALKYLVRRPRPPLFVRMEVKIKKGPGEILDPSFPSAHTAYAFMMATILAHWFPGHCALFFIVAGFVGWTRIYLDLHYPTDVLAGALLGFCATAVSISSWPGFSLSK
jgi:undecaprenyl-diphosphatase